LPTASEMSVSLTGLPLLLTVRRWIATVSDKSDTTRGDDEASRYFVINSSRYASFPTAPAAKTYS